jgi:hypothetical protein
MVRSQGHFFIPLFGLLVDILAYKNYFKGEWQDRFCDNLAHKQPEGFPPMERGPDTRMGLAAGREARESARLALPHSWRRWPLTLTGRSCLTWEGWGLGACIECQQYRIGGQPWQKLKRLAFVPNVNG